MAKFKVRHLVSRPGGPGGLPRYYWQPSALLRAEGFALHRVPRNYFDYFDPVALKTAAMAAAEELNKALDLERATRRADPQHQRPAKPPPRTLDGLIEQYKRSKLWARAAPSTKRGYDQCFGKLSQWAGDASVASITYPRCERLMDAFSRTPSYGQHVLRVLRLLLNHGCRLGWIGHNPVQKLVIHRGVRGASGIVWPEASVEAFVATADAMAAHSIGTAVFVNAWLGQRQGDVLRLHRGLLQNGNLLIVQSKTRARVSLPVNQIPAVMKRLTEEMARIDAAGYRARPVQIIVDEATGRAYNGDRFRHRYAEVRAALARTQPHFDADFIVPGRSPDDPAACRVRATELQFMHLRHTAVVRLAESGATDEHIAAVTGHSLRSVASTLQHYLVKTRQSAAQAFALRLAHQQQIAATRQSRA